MTEQIVTAYIDTYVSSPSLDLMQDFLANYPVHIPVQQGRAAQRETVDSETGDVCEAISAAGDPNRYYSCIRTPASIVVHMPDSLSVVDLQTGSAVLGVFL